MFFPVGPWSCSPTAPQFCLPVPTTDRNDVDYIPLLGTGQGLMTKRTLFLGRIPGCMSSVTVQIVRNYSLLILLFEACFVET